MKGCVNNNSQSETEKVSNNVKINLRNYKLLNSKEIGKVIPNNFRGELYRCV